METATNNALRMHMHIPLCKTGSQQLGRNTMRNATELVLSSADGLQKINHTFAPVPNVLVVTNHPSSDQSTSRVSIPLGRFAFAASTVAAMWKKERTRTSCPAEAGSRVRDLGGADHTIPTCGIGIVKLIACSTLKCRVLFPEVFRWPVEALQFQSVVKRVWKCIGNSN